MNQPKAAWSRASGIFVREVGVAIIVTFLLGWFFARVVGLAYPSTVLALVITYFAFRGGLWPGLAAALVTVGWTTYKVLHTFTPGVFPTESMQRLAASIIAMPVLALIVTRFRETQRKSLRELSAAHASLNSFIEASPLAIYRLDMNGIVRSWNGAAAQIFGWTEEEVVGRIPPTVGPGWEPEFKLLLERVLRGDTIRDLKVARSRRDGVTIITSLSAAPVHGESGAIDGVIVLLSDVTAAELADEALRRQAALLEKQAAALRASEGTYRMLMEQASDGIFIVTRDGRFETVNSQACTMLGYTANQLASKRVSDIVSVDPEDSQRGIARLHAGETVLSERELRRKDGTFVPVEISSKMLPDGRMQAIVRDISERRSTEEVLREREAELRQAQKMEAIGRLAGGVAHDFNNLLTAIQGHTQLLLEDVPVTDPMHEELTEISKAADRAASLTRQLLAFSRKQVLQPKLIDLNHVISDMQRMLARLIGEDVELDVSLDGDIGRVRADPGQLQQVLMNLVVNARDALPRGGTLRIQTRNATLDHTFTRQNPGSKAGEYVSLEVCDTGTGMAAETLSKVFEPFFTTKPAGSGTGLGLSTVYGIVKQSEGYIKVESEMGKGTTFTLYLPRVGAGETDEIASTAVPAPVTAGTVLLVEDEDAVRGLVHKVLERRGYHMLVAHNGREALRVSEEYAGIIDLLVTDVIMPEMGGPELARSIARARPAIRILYMSGYSEAAIEQHGVLEQGTAFLEKPFTPDVLVERVRSILDGDGAQSSA